MRARRLELVGERAEAVEHARIDTLARKIERQPARLDAAMIEALRILREQLSRVGRSERPGETFELPPGRTVSAGAHSFTHGRYSAAAEMKF